MKIKLKKIIDLGKWKNFGECVRDYTTNLEENLDNVVKDLFEIADDAKREKKRVLEDVGDDLCEIVKEIFETVEVCCSVDFDIKNGLHLSIPIPNEKGEFHSKIIPLDFFETVEILNQCEQDDEIIALRDTCKKIVDRADEIIKENSEMKKPGMSG